jgi:hypothetical protein
MILPTFAGSKLQPGIAKCGSHIGVIFVSPSTVL